MRRLALAVFTLVLSAPGCSRSPEEISSAPAKRPPATASAAASAASATAAATTAALPPIPFTTAAPPNAANEGPAVQGEEWNPKAIEWLGFDDGLEKAKKLKKPICLVLFATWCQHCRNYSKVFNDPRLVLRAKDFVMVRVDADQDSDLAKRFSKDGGYIPRTFFLSPDGTPDYDIHAPRPQYAYFFDEKNPASLLAGMEEATRKLRN